jgi:hypothetical protein
MLKIRMDKNYISGNPVIVLINEEEQLVATINLDLPNDRISVISAWLEKIETSEADVLTDVEVPYTMEQYSFKIGKVKKRVDFTKR